MGSLRPSLVKSTIVYTNNLPENRICEEKRQCIIRALEKQQPMIPSFETSDGDSSIVCPCCDTIIGDFENDGLWCDYCPGCGQRIDKNIDYGGEFDGD